MSVQPGMPEHKGLADRIKTLEAKVARLARARTMQSTSLDGGTFRVKNGGKIELVDDSGNVVAELDKDSQTFFDVNGNPLTVLDGSGLSIKDGGNVTVEDGGAFQMVTSGGTFNLTPFRVISETDSDTAFTITTTLTTINEVTLTIPSWVTSVVVVSFAELGAEGTSDELTNVIVNDVGGEDDQEGVLFTIPAGNPMSAMATLTTIVASPGSSIVCRQRVSSTLDTQTGMSSRLQTLAIFT